MKTIHRQETTSSDKKSIPQEKRIPQEMLNRAVDNFNVGVAVVLSYSSVVHGTNTALITEKV